GRMQKKDIVALAFIGDGGSSTGAFWEGLNFATVQRLPMVVVIENNAYAYSTPTSKQTAAKTLADQAAGVGCESEPADSNDVLAVYDAARRAVERARGGGGVTLIEVLTFRLKGHAEHDNQSYVPQEIIDEWRGKDAIERYERLLVDEGVATDEELAAIAKRGRAEVDAGAEEAERAPMPRGEGALGGGFAGNHLPRRHSHRHGRRNGARRPRLPPGRGRRRLRRRIRHFQRPDRSLRRGARDRHADLRDGHRRRRVGRGADGDA